MKTTKVAVFGNYDSRGGTTAVVLPDRPTLEDVKEAMKRYDEALYHWSGTLKDYDEHPEMWTWNPHERVDCWPSRVDFLYVADLHHPETVKLEGDMDYAYQDEVRTAVLVSESSVLDEERDAEEAIRYFLERPVQMEVVEISEAMSEKDLEARARVISNPEAQVWGDDAYGFLIQ